MQIRRSPGAPRGGRAALAVFLLVSAASCGGGTAAGGDAGGAGGSAAGGPGGGAGGNTGAGAGGAGGGAGTGAAGGAGGSGAAAGGAADAGQDSLGDATGDLPGDALGDGDAAPDGSDGGCGSRPLGACVYGAPHSCSDVGAPFVCSDGTWKCPAGAMPFDACICFDRPPFGRVCPDGGAPEACVEGPLPSPICGAQCGNGARDSCRFRRGTQAACPELMGTEDCDGQDFGGESCQRQGYAAGPLTCSAACAIDTSTCTACAPPSAPVAACGAAPGGAMHLGDMSLAATDTEVGLVWTDADDPAGYRVSFTRLTPALAALGTTVLETSLAQVGVAVAPLPAGWVVGVGGDDGLGGTAVSFHTLDADGRPVDHVTLEGGLVGEGGWWNPLMAARPGGGPLIVWQTADAVRAAVIADDGRSATTPVSIAIAPDDFVTDAAYIGGAFFVTSLAPTNSQYDAPYKLSVARIETDGRATSVVEALPGEISDFAALVAGAPDLRIVYTGFAPPDGEHRTYWRRLDGAGAAASPAVEIEPDPYGFGIQSRAVALGDDAVVLLDESNVLLRMARVTAAGAIGTPARDVAAAPGLYSVAVTRRGPEVVFGWISPLGIGLARIAP